MILPRLFLIGMMGSGKSYWKNQLCHEINIEGYDLDHMIESSLNKSISQIFEADGESYFRRAEASQLRLFEDKDRFVLSTGGGTPCFNDNMRWMNEHGTTIWIDEPVHVLVDRLLPEKNHRPLIAHLSKEELSVFLQSKLMERLPFYSKAKIHLQHPVTRSSFAAIIEQYA